MKSLIKVLCLLAVCLTTAEAKWEGFYGRGGVSVLGAAKDGNFNFEPLFAVAAGYGAVIPNLFSHGLYVGLDIEGIRKSEFGYSHEAFMRFGFPRAQCMLYVGPKGGYNTTHEYGFWGVKGGMDFDFILPGFFWGIHADWTIPFKEIPSTIQTGFTFGYRF
ncbi:MAG: hypothetical protein H6492_02375 [Candidatus Paracaedibacteraceae bacterium]|nr:hypothetical protein [Candidatus Paracaedibacteraceae bacterium]